MTGSTAAVHPLPTAPVGHVAVDTRVARAASVWTRIAAIYTRCHHEVQIEYSGRYSLEKALYLFYHKQSKLHQFSLLVLSPWACLIIAMLSESIPLEEPTHGWRGCPLFFARSFFRSTAFHLGFLVSIEEIIPEVAMPVLQVLWLSMLLSACFQVSIVVVAEVTGIFPVPFTFFAITPIYVVLSGTIHLFFIRKIMFDRQDPLRTKAFREKLAAASRIITAGPLIMLLYAGYATIFPFVPYKTQLLLTVVLQILKLGAKRVMWQRAQVTKGSHDLAGEHVISSAHFFHAMFTATSLQASKSILAQVILIGWSATHDVFTIRSIVKMTKQADALWHTIPAKHRQRGKAHLMATMIHRHSTLPPTGTTDIRTEAWAERTAANHTAPYQFPIKSSYWRHSKVAQSIMQDLLKSDTSVVDTASTLSTREATTTTEQVTSSREAAIIAWLDVQMHLFHVREMVLLRMYVDMFVYCYFMFLVMVVKKLYNVKYHEYIIDMDVDSLAHRVVTQLVIKLIAMLVLLLAVARMQRGDPAMPSALDHLTFVLYAHRYTMQSKLMVTGLVVLDFSLKHLGNDLSFRFDWIRHRDQPP